MIKFSVCIITFNEEKNIKRCLDSLQGLTDDVIIVDSYSTDKTIEIIKKYENVRLFQNTWPGFPKQRNYAASKAKYDWIFWLDADEMVSPELNNELIALNDPEDYQAFEVPRLDIFYGRWIKHGGWYPQHHLNLYNKNYLSWNEALVIHEKLLYDKENTKIGKLNNPRLHFSHLTLRDTINTFSKYTDLEAKSLFYHHKRTNVVMMFFLMIYRIFAQVFGRYLILQGFRDGIYGFFIAILMGFYKFLIFAKYFTIRYYFKNRKKVSQIYEKYNLDNSFYEEAIAFKPSEKNFGSVKPMNKPIKSKPQKRVIIIGLDGATWDVIQPLIDKGQMQNIAKFMKQGVWGHMKSTFPPLTCPAWFSFSTGKNPGRFGAFNFYMMKNASYDVTQPTNALMMDQKELWDLFNDAGYSCGIINNPIVYPVKKIKEFMVAGFLAPSENVQYTHPVEMKDELDKIADSYELDASHGEKEDKIVIDGCFRVLDKRFKVLDHFMKNNHQDFFMGVFTATDRIQHQLLNKYFSDDEKERDDVRPVIENFFNKLDDHIGKLLEHTTENDWVLIMSDHGFNKRDKGFLINQFLIQEGYLKVFPQKKSTLERIGFTQRGFKKFLDRYGLKAIEKIVRAKTPKIIRKIIPGGAIEGEGRSIIDMMEIGAIDWSKTKAIALPGGIYLNTKDRPQGIVEPGEESECLIKELREKLEKLHLPDGGKIKIETFRPKDVYKGRFVDQAPDLMLVIENYQYGLTTNILKNRAELVEPLKLAHHRENAMLIMKGPNIKKGEEFKGAEIIDITPTILHLFDLAIPQEIDGKVLKGIFEPNSHLAEKPVKMKQKDEKNIIDDAIDQLEL